MIKKFLALLVIFATACQSNDISKDNEPNLRTLSAAETQVSAGSNQFAFNLFKKIQKDEPENIFISPLIVITALAMTLNGAEGETQQSILNTIDYGDFPAAEVNQGYKDISSLLTSMDNKVELGMANSVWYSNKYHVQNSFSEIITDSYDGIVQGLDFKNETESKQSIYGWVEQKTHDRIKNLIEEIPDERVMFLVNAIYFKGDWAYQFDKSKTHDAPFSTPDGQITADLMFSKGVKMNLYSNSNMRLVDIPYGNEQFSLTVLMPHEAADLKALISNLNATDFSFWLSQANAATLELELPKFRMEWKMDLKDKLSDMGMRMYGFPKLFEEDLDLEVSAVIHQSFIDVNEEGSEAAAATAVGVSLTSAGPPTKITLDKSFVFMIRERHSGVILFMGQLVDPDKL
jgi:serine protease inhibitor